MSDLKLDGFKPASTEVRYRLMISSEGAERTGKTHFALTMPAPIAVLPLDNNTEEVVTKFRRAGKQILTPSDPIDWEQGLPKDVYDRVWTRTEKAVRTCLSTPGPKSLMPDTGTELWELCRLAAFGKVTQVQPHHYGPVKEEFRKLLRALKESHLNVVIPHKVKKRYVGNKPRPGMEAKEAWDGTYERAGMDDTGFLCQMQIVHGYNPASRQFFIRIKDCTPNMDLAGMTLGMGGTPEQETCDFELEPTFANLGMLAYPESSEEDWT